MNNLILFGFKGSGKTYWGKQIAQALQRPFIDTDSYIEQRYHPPRSCPDIYHDVGQEAFRALEHEVILSLKGTTNTVIALGGGTILCPHNRLLLQHLGVLIYLKVEKDILKMRTPPSFSSFEELYAERLPLYESIPAQRIVLANKSEACVLQELCKSKN